jgi:hypothetical protein
MILLKKVGGGAPALFRASSSSSSSFSSSQTLRKSRTRTKDEDGYDGRWGVCPMQLLFRGTFSAESYLQFDPVAAGPRCRHDREAAVRRRKPYLEQVVLAAPESAEAKAARELLAEFR